MLGLECSLAAEMRLEVQLWQLGRSSREAMGGKLHELMLAACSEADGPPTDALQVSPMHRSGLEQTLHPVPCTLNRSGRARAVCIQSCRYATFWQRWVAMEVVPARSREMGVSLGGVAGMGV